MTHILKVKVGKKLLLPIVVASNGYVVESDNLGSTDSEVKKILTLHLPISEYDTLGSDSEGDGRVTSQELMSFSHRIRGAYPNKPNIWFIVVFLRWR